MVETIWNEIAVLGPRNGVSFHDTLVLLEAKGDSYVFLLVLLSTLESATGQKSTLRETRD